MFQYWFHATELLVLTLGMSFISCSHRDVPRTTGWELPGGNVVDQSDLTP